MLVVVAAPELDRHRTGTGHPERAARVPAALSGIDAAGLRDAVVSLEPRRATVDELSLAHRTTYVDALRSFCHAGGGAIDPDTVAVPESWDTALLAAGAPLVAVDALRSGQGDAGFVAMRPPGHHATEDQAMGFCLMNNVAVAAASIAAGGERVLVVDWDVHHGNGTQSIFWDDPRVMYVSMHQWPLFPGTGRASEVGGPNAVGTNLNVPLPPGTTGDVLLQAVDEVLAPAADRFAPHWVLVSAGYDGHRRDPLADFSLSAGDFADLAKRVHGLAPHAGRTVVVLEGGYDEDALRASVGATLAAMLGEEFRPEAATSGGPGASAVAAARLEHDRGSGS